MNQETFQIFLWVMSAVALVVFIALYFVKAGYGMFRTASWGISINNKLAWVLMEAPVFIVMFGLWGRSGVGFSVPVYLFTCIPCNALSVGEEWSGICRAGIFLLPAVSVALSSAGLYFSVPAER